MSRRDLSSGTPKMTLRFGDSPEGLTELRKSITFTVQFTTAEGHRSQSESKRQSRRETTCGLTIVLVADLVPMESHTVRILLANVGQHPRALPACKLTGALVSRTFTGGQSCRRRVSAESSLAS